MSLIISELIKEFNLKDNVCISNEQPFDVFSRVSSFIDGKKCVYISNEKFIKSIDDSVSMVITTSEIADKIIKNCGICSCDNPRGLFFELLSLYERNYKSSRFDTEIGKDCQISGTAVISPYNVKIGNNVKIGDFVVINSNTIIGDNVILQSGAKIAEQDFNVYNYGGITKQVFHSGEVVVGSNVLISPNVLIGQALFCYGKTIIGNNSFIGAGTCVGHNTEIGSGCEICGNSMIGGFCKIGNNTKMFMNTTIANNLNIGEEVTVNVGSVVIRDVKNDKTVFGNPAREIITPK